MRLLIAIPIFNELKYVGRVLSRLRQFHDDILVIDDGSTDGTRDLLKKRKDIQLLLHPQNRGYGQSVIDSFKYADAHGYDWVITMDCDEQHEPEMIPEFIKHIRTDKWDIISGSRYMQSNHNDDLPPQDRRAINVAVTSCVNDIYHLGLTDAFCGFKAHRVSAMRQLNLDEPGYAFPLQLWPRAAAVGLRITEIPVRLIYNDPNRHFGGLLDDADIRLKHYFSVLNREVQQQQAAIPEPEREDCSCCCPVS